MPRKRRTPLLASAPVATAFRIGVPIESSSWSDVEAASSGSAPLRKFAIVAYTGGAMTLWGWRYPVVIDLAGLAVSAKSRPVLMNHDSSLIVGHTTQVAVASGEITLEGVVSGTGDAAQQVVATSRNGFPWQASIGASARRWEEVKAGDKVVVNGREHVGPLYVIRASDLKEVSFVALGADDNTSAAVAAGARRTQEIAMNFEQWLAAKGFALASLTDTQRTALQAAYDAEQASDDDGGAAPITAAASDAVAAGGTDPNQTPALQEIQRNRAAVAADMDRIAGIRQVAADHPTIAAQAIRDGWTRDRTELQVLRASRPTASGPYAGSGAPAPSRELLEAGIALSIGSIRGVREDSIVASVGAQNAEGARSLRMHRMGLRDLCAAAARLDGIDVPSMWGDGEATIRAGFTSSSLATILGNTLGRELLRVYGGLAVAALQVARRGSVSDFKAVSRTRMLANGRWERVGRGGDLQHGMFSDQNFTIQADTSGEVAVIDRKSFIDDDLGAFAELPTHWAMAAAASIDHEFFTLLLAAQGTFFQAGNGNYVTGAGTAFGVDSVSDVRALFRKIKAAPKIGAVDGKSRFININPSIFLLPPELEADGDILVGSAQVMTDGNASAKKLPVDNPHRGKYTVAVAPHLSDAAYTGFSTKAWYMFAPPELYPAAEVAFLNGRDAPTIEQVTPPPGVLGFAWNAYIDFGVAMLDPRAAIKAKGEA